MLNAPVALQRVLSTARRLALLRVQDGVVGQADVVVEVVEDVFGGWLVGDLGLVFHFDVALEAGFDVRVLERGLVHGQTILAPGGPEIDDDRFVFAFGLFESLG